MINFKIKKNKGPVSPSQGGFTLVETMFAIYILTFTIVGLMTVVANSLFSARYAKDEITVNYLLQEVVDYVRNDRDTTVFLESGGDWNSFFETYDNCSAPNGCYFDVLTPNPSPVDPKTCPSGECPFLYYDESANDTPFYVNEDGDMGIKVKTNFKRKIIIQNASNPDEIDVTITINWKNGSKEVTRSLSTSLMNWQK